MDFVFVLVLFVFFVGLVSSSLSFRFCFLLLESSTKGNEDEANIKRRGKQKVYLVLPLGLALNH